MAICPNCAANNNDNAKFCSSCGGALPVSAPVQPQPQAQPVQPAYQQPVQPAYQQPVYQAPVIQQQVQPVKNTVKNNGMCTAGFVLSLIGIFTVGLTSIFGLIFSVIGLIVSGKKKEGGKGKAIAGIIMSVIMIILVISVYVISFSSSLSNYIDKAEAVAESVRSGSVDDDKDIDYVKMIEKNNWITMGDNSYMVFDKKNKSFTYYQSYLDTSDNYYSGTYHIYAGQDAFDYITEDLDELGVEKDELRQMINMNEEYEMDNLICICLDYDELIVDGERQDREPWTIHYYGFYLTPEEDGETYNVLDVANMEAMSYVTFVLEKDFKDYFGSSANSAYGTDSVTTSDHITDPVTTSATDTYIEPTYDGDTEVMGDSTTGYVFLTEGTWDYWTEADGMGDYYLAREQRINRDTSAIINLTVMPQVYNKGEGVDISLIVESSVQSLQDSDDVTNAYYTKTTLGGFEAYEIYSQYKDGMILSVWYFYDNEDRLHYVSVEYYSSDIASYNMVKDTFTMYH